MPEKDKLEIKLDQKDKLVFPTTSYTRNISSTTLLEELRTLFEVFEDFAGFEANFNAVNGAFTINAYFSQIDSTTSEYRGFTRRGLNDKSANLLDRINNMGRISENGNKFYITDEAKEMIAPFIHHFAKNRDGSVDWKNCITTKGSLDSFGRPAGPEFSVIMNIDPILLMRTAYGDKLDVIIGKDDDGNPITELKSVKYEIVNKGSVPSPNNFAHNTGNNSNGPFILDVRAVVEDVFEKEKPKLGIATFGPRII